MKLFIIATPIGNLSDLTSRAIETFKEVDAILCEDTRMTLRILNHLDLKKTLVSFHQHSDDRKFRDVLEMMRAGKNLGLVTDAGTPGISDPGGLLVAAAVKEFGSELEVIPIPGACAAIAALSVSGFPTDKFLFLGFPPHKKGRKSYFERIAETEETVCFYESTHRILKTLEELGGVIGERQLVVCRELTKLHETTYRGTAFKVTELLEKSSIKGEFVIVVESKK